MKLGKKILYGMCGLLFTLMIVPVVMAEAENIKTSDAVVSGTLEKGKIKAGWFQKGKTRYYRMKNGQLCRKKWVKIGKYYYSFDSKGRMQTGIVRLSREYSGYFSKKTGRFLYNFIDLKVTRVSKNYVTAQNKGEGLYTVWTKGEKILNTSWKKTSPSAIKKNTDIRVYFRGSIQEIYPAQFEKVAKVRIRR